MGADRQATTPGTVARVDGAREQLAKAVAALRRPEAYPEPAAQVEAIETHMSWVFLTPSHAYKLKKPLRTADFDHTDREARRRACETELLLNRRLAASVYLAVIALSERGGVLRVAEPGEPVDWLVKMRRLPRERMLDACIARGDVTEADVNRLSVVLTAFYTGADRASTLGPAYRRRLCDDLTAKRDSLLRPRYGLDAALVEAVFARQRRWLSQHAEQLEARAADVVDAHGDLRPEHVCLEPQPVIIDCLEFSRPLRLLDPVSELSFLALECLRLGAAWIGEQLLTRYQEQRGDSIPPGLMAFYQSQHAMIRAALAVWHLDDEALDHSDKWRGRAHDYLRIANQLW